MNIATRARDLNSRLLNAMQVNGRTIQLQSATGELVTFSRTAQDRWNGLALDEALALLSSPAARSDVADINAVLRAVGAIKAGEVRTFESGATVEKLSRNDYRVTDKAGKVYVSLSKDHAALIAYKGV